ncbi:MAG TPA: DUF5777 family beta-barrel protein [Thermoanaerobaculia bacterium]|nr:DUF5777 family beta-barrel protein [Thermoanaerobaculia bacterium]
MRSYRRILSAALIAAAAAGAFAQEKEKPDAATPKAEAPPEMAETGPEPFRPPEGSIIINLPSAEVNPLRNLQLHFTHRFSEPLNDSNFHDLFSFDSGADVGIGLSYVPVKDLEVGFLRYRSLEDWETWAKYRFLSASQGASPVDAALRVGGNFRAAKTPDICEESPRPPGCSFADHKNSFFAQAIAGITFFGRVRVTVVPTYITYSAQQPFVVTESVHSDVFNVPFAVAIAVTHSINIQAEVVPRRSSAQAGGVGYITAIEKTLLRHRFAFTIGNIRPTTVDQYIGPDFRGQPNNYYIGFNLTRLWKL